MEKSLSQSPFYANSTENSGLLGSASALLEDTKSHSNERIANKDGFHGVPALSRRKKKAKGMPKRPLSAYNLFFQRELSLILRGGQRLSFEDLGKIIGKRWRDLPSSDREEHENLVLQEIIRYREEVEEYNSVKRKRIANMDKLPEHARESFANEHISFSELCAEEYGCYSGERGGLPLRASRHPVPFPNMVASHPLPHYPGETSGSGPFPRLVPSAGVVPVPHSALLAPSPATDPSLFSIPSGREVLLPDRDGSQRKYKLQYTCYIMPRTTAQ